MSNPTRQRRFATQLPRAAGPVLTPTQRPGLLAAAERALQRALQRASAGLGSALP